jgi:putative DNA primase/helicase
MQQPRSSRWSKEVQFLKGVVHPANEATLTKIRKRVVQEIEQAYQQARDWREGSPPVKLIAAPVGSGKSTEARRAAVRWTEQEHSNVVILVSRHKLGDEQADELRCDYPGVSVAIWRGRRADDPLIPGKKICWREEDLKQVEEAWVDADRLCKQGRGKNSIKCPFYELCGHQRQKEQKARIWFAAHECLVHEKPKALGEIGWIIIDENPLDALMFGVDEKKPVTLTLSDLCKPPPKQRCKDAWFLKSEREELHQALAQLDDGAPVSLPELRPFTAWNTPHYNIGLERSCKVAVAISPNMSGDRLRAAVQPAQGNVHIDARVKLWGVLDALAKDAPRIKIKLRSENGRPVWRITLPVVQDKQCGRIRRRGDLVHVTGLNSIRAGWNAPILICDATGEPELLRAIWPQLEAKEWPALPRPKSVRVTQVVDCSFAMKAIAITGQGDELKRRKRAALSVYAWVMQTAMQFGGKPVAIITYKSTAQWLKDNCFVPPWLTILHYGAVDGTNALAGVRALFEIGRPLPRAQAMTARAEALFGHAVEDEEYDYGPYGVIPIVPDAQGHTTVEVRMHRHRDRWALMLLQQVHVGGVV